MGISSFLGLTGGPDLHAEVARLRRQVALLEKQVEFLADVQGADLRRVAQPPMVSDEVYALVREGKDIAAIKRHREQTGLDLVSAKGDVEHARRMLR